MFLKGGQELHSGKLSAEKRVEVPRKEGKSPERSAGDRDHGRTLRGGGLVRHHGGGTAQGYECPVVLAKLS